MRAFVISFRPLIWRSCFLRVPGQQSHQSRRPRWVHDQVYRQQSPGNADCQQCSSVFDDLRAQTDDGARWSRSFSCTGYRDDGHLRQGHAGPYRHHRSRVIGIHDFSVGNVHDQFSGPIMRVLGARIHNAPGSRPPALLTRAGQTCACHAVLLGAANRIPGMHSHGPCSQVRTSLSARTALPRTRRCASASSRDDQGGCPPSPGGAVVTESLDVDHVDPAVADPASHQWAIRARHLALCAQPGR